MEKKIINAMYKTIVSKDPIRPMMMGVFFDTECAVASDTHVLVVYKHKFPTHEGKVLDANGEEIKGGAYPNYKRVFPAKEKLNKYHPRIDLVQLQKACAWWMRQPGVHEDDVLVIRGKGFKIKFLSNLLSFIALTPELKKGEMFQTPDGNPMIIKTKSFDGLLMPVMYEESHLDEDRQEDCLMVISLENLINQYVFEGWKPREVPDPMAWL